MKRYANTIIETGIGTYEEMAEHPEGNWIKYEDVKTALALLNSHAALVEALEKAQAVIGDLVRYGNASDDETEAYENIKQALTLAKEGA